LKFIVKADAAANGLFGSPLYRTLFPTVKLPNQSVPSTRPVKLPPSLMLPVRARLLVTMIGEDCATALPPPSTTRTWPQSKKSSAPSAPADPTWVTAAWACTASNTSAAANTGARKTDVIRLDIFPPRDRKTA